jgi:hypothetical protein
MAKARTNGNGKRKMATMKKAKKTKKSMTKKNRMGR